MLGLFKDFPVECEKFFDFVDHHVDDSSTNPVHEVALGFEGWDFVELMEVDGVALIDRIEHVHLNIELIVVGDGDLHGGAKSTEGDTRDDAFKVEGHRSSFLASASVT